MGVAQTSYCHPVGSRESWKRACKNSLLMSGSLCALSQASEMVNKKCCLFSSLL